MMECSNDNHNDNDKVGYADLNFGEAIVALKGKCKLARRGWNGKGMHIFYTPSKTVFTDKPGNGDVYLSHIDMFTVRKTIQVGWLASQSDLLANAWYIV